MKEAILISLLFSATLAFAQNKSGIAERTNLRNYAFCECIYHSDTTQRQLLMDDGSAAGYVEMGTSPLPAYQKVDSLAKIWASKKYHSKYNRKLSIMKCLDFYNSKSLIDNIQLLVPVRK